MYDVVLDWVTEITKLGTGILKWRYMREQRRMYEWREQPGGVLAQMVSRMAVNRPDVKRVALPDFFVPATAGSVQDAAWCAERLQLTYDQLQRRVRAGIYLPDVLDRIAYSWRSGQPASQYGAYQNVQQQLDNFLPGLNDRFELFEFWLNYEIERGTEPVAVVCTIHVPTMTYARIDFNPFFSQEKPYAEARFIRQEGRFYGLGLGDILEMFQEEISTMHCQRIDNNTIKNAAVFKGKTGSGVKPDEPIWPGRTIMMQDPEHDLVPMFMGQVATSTIGDEEFTLQYARQRSNVSDFQRGGAGNASISYSTATTTVEMLRQGRLRLDQVLREIQSGLGKVGRGVVELYQQFDQQGKTYLVMGQQDGAVVQQVLQFPLDMLRSGVAVRVTATNAQLNKETQIRTNQIIFGMVMQFYQQMMQAMTYAFNPQVPPPMQQMAMAWVQGGMVLARRILDEYNIQDIDRIIPDIGGPGGGQQQQLIQPAPQYGGAPMAPGLAGPPRLPPGGVGYPGTNGTGPTDLGVLGRYAASFPGTGQMAG
jgi:hypothetical protein